jgi:hypothetical protein
MIIQDIPQLALEQSLQKLLEPLIERIAHRVKDLKKSVQCAIVYAWPISYKEQYLQEGILRLVADLQSVGVTVSFDCSVGNTISGLHKRSDKWIKNSDVVLLIGSLSLVEMAKDSSTLTYFELEAVETKKDVVIPVLMSGEDNVFPLAYQDTKSVDATQLIYYLKEIPRLLLGVLGLERDRVLFEHVEAYLKEVDTKIEACDKDNGGNLEEANVELVKRKAEEQSKFWESKVLIHRASFRSEQYIEVGEMLLSTATELALHKPLLKHQGSPPSQGSPDEADDDVDDLPFIEDPKRSQFIGVTFVWPYVGNSVLITGSFFNWRNTIALHCYKSKTEESFSTILYLPPGEYEYKFIIDGAWHYDPKQPVVTDETGSLNNFIVVESLPVTRTVEPLFNNGFLYA